MALNPADMKFIAEVTGKVVKEFVKVELDPIRDRIAEIELRGIEYKGVYQRASTYRRGSVVTFDGSVWIATNNVEENQAPNAGPDCPWQLAVKRGRDGKDVAR